MGETYLAFLLCGLLGGGDVEQRHDFTNLGRPRGIRVDCETPTHVIEVGLDKVSSRDSVHQAIFSQIQSGKRGAVVVIDTDGVEGRYEYEIRLVAAQAGIPYVSCGKSFIQRWRMTQAFRPTALDQRLDDLPRTGVAKSICDLSRIYGTESS